MAARWDRYPPYVPVAKRQNKNAKMAKKLSKELAKKALTPHPITIEGRKIKLARSFWGAGWINHLSSFSDFENRLPRGRSYLRQGAVLDLQIEQGVVKALVNGSRLYEVTINIKTLPAARWNKIRKACSGQIGSLLELLQGKLSDEVMTIVTDHKQGLLPRPGEIELDCSCPDWAEMCKHVAATLFGIGVRLDEEPELLFQLRGVDPADLITGDLALPAGDGDAESFLDEGDLGDIFGIELERDAKGASPSTVGASPPEKALAALTLARPKAKAAAFKTTGPFIARLRADFGLSVREFAEILNVSAVTVYRWEKSRRKLFLQGKNLDLLQALSDRRREILESK